MRQALIDQYCEGPGVVTAALAGATEDELNARPGPDEWSAREVVHHLADSEATSYIRLRRLLAEDDPVIYGYDEAEFARRLHYDRPIAASLAVLKSVRARRRQSCSAASTTTSGPVRARIPKAALTRSRRGSRSTQPTLTTTRHKSAARGHARSRTSLRQLTLREEAAVFFVECDSHDGGFVLLNPDHIVSIRNTAHGVELDWQCWCGNVGTWHPRRDEPAAA